MSLDAPVARQVVSLSRRSTTWRTRVNQARPMVSLSRRSTTWRTRVTQGWPVVSPSPCSTTWRTRESGAAGGLPEPALDDVAHA
ncbi:MULTISPECIES: hypothetical protein [unclassified Myxococcus]|uniref:hypothetical protein n=1 Tax=unclassified Myxococcus TaxID=2648731 RepID=UPI001CBF15D4|nr:MULTISPECIES: hypothetical protein [unclassified Myxococcus]MBZ4394514.1 hypothetical protein [Myxococcus sp. AS-1-15]MBZ4409985.1 hypothetical protein [Myxococcus sp. XM-1-1-1]